MFKLSLPATLDFPSSSESEPQDTNITQLISPSGLSSTQAKESSPESTTLPEPGHSLSISDTEENILRDNTSSMSSMLKPPRKPSGLEKLKITTPEKLPVPSEFSPQELTRLSSVLERNSLTNSPLRTTSENPSGLSSTFLTELLVMPQLDLLSELSLFPESTPSELNQLIKPETLLKVSSPSLAEMEDLNPSTK